MKTKTKDAIKNATLILLVFGAVGLSCNLKADPLPMGKNNQEMLIGYQNHNMNHVANTNIKWKAKRACTVMKAWGKEWETCNKAMYHFYYLERADVLKEREHDNNQHVAGRY